MADFRIETTWDNQAITSHDPVHVRLLSAPAQEEATPTGPRGIRLEVDAPFFDQPQAPPAPPGQPCPELWDYEVVEAFFLNDKDQYLEVELCPHGQHLVLMLNGRRNIVQEQLALEFSSQITGNRWHGSAVIPMSYLPPCVTRFNAFAIHGEGESRTYEALFPATDPHSYPDFHRLEYFGAVDLSSISPSTASQTHSDLWDKYPPISS